MVCGRRHIFTLRTSAFRKNTLIDAVTDEGRQRHIRQLNMTEVIVSTMHYGKILYFGVNHMERWSQI